MGEGGGEGEGGEGVRGRRVACGERGDGGGMGERGVERGWVGGYVRRGGLRRS